MVFLKSAKFSTMKVVHQLVKDIPHIPVDEVLVGVFSTLVKAGSMQGIASTLKGQGPHGYIDAPNGLSKRSLRELADLLLAEDTLKASIGMAAVNAWMAARPHALQYMNAKKLIYEAGKGKIVGVIGHFPFVEHMNEARKRYIFEKQPQQGDMREQDIQTYMPQVDVAVITGTSIINHTFERIMQFVKPDAFTIVMGPSTPLAPVLFSYGVDAVCGTLVADYNKMRRGVLEAVPFRHLQGKTYATWLGGEALANGYHSLESQEEV